MSAVERSSVLKIRGIVVQKRYKYPAKNAVTSSDTKHGAYKL